MHLDEKAIAEHLAGINPQASQHVATCPVCADRAAETEMVATFVFGDDETPPQFRRTRGVELAHTNLERAVVEREVNPTAALASARAALASLSPAQEPAIVYRLLRAAAFREIANCHRYLGSYAEALASVESAEREVRDIGAAEFERARIAFTRATVLWKIGVELPSALTAAEMAAEVFRSHGDEVRATHAKMLIGGIHFLSRDFARALAIFEEALRSSDGAADAITYAELQHNAAACYQELGDLATAALRFREALVVYEHLGMTIERLRTEWLLALMSLRSGHVADGQRRLQQVSAEFVSHGNAAEGALALIDLAEDLVMRGARSEAVAVLRAIDRATVGPFVASQLDVLEQVSRDGELIHQLRDLRAIIETSPP